MKQEELENIYENLKRISKSKSLPFEVLRAINYAKNIVNKHRLKYKTKHKTRKKKYQEFVGTNPFESLIDEVHDEKVVENIREKPNPQVKRKKKNKVY